jgi:hypothetical protein
MNLREIGYELVSSGSGWDPLVGLFEHERNFLSRATAEESPYTLELFEINDLPLCVKYGKILIQGCSACLSVTC